MSQMTTNTEVTQVSADDLDNLLGMPGAETVITAATATDEPDPKPTFFDNGNTDLSFLDGNDEPIDDPAKVVDNIIDDLNPPVPNVNDEKKPGGRPTLDKDGMAQLAKTLIDDGIILPFEDDKPLEEYTLEDYKELFSMNIQEKERSVKEKTPVEFFQSLPPELQYAAKYVADGGTDMKGLFKALAQAEETKSMDISTERGQETVVREYLKANNFGSDEEIQDEIDSWKDLAKLEAKAQQFKPKLDKMQEQLLQRQIQQQEAKRKQQEEASLNYANSIYDTLAKGELNGIKLNNKVQSMLYQGLIQPNYPSISGAQTNLFGHLIEKHQFVEPNHGLIAEALWLLADPDGYRAELRKEAKNETAAETARQLRFEQANKGSGTGTNEPVDRSREQRQAIKRPNKNFFTR